MNVKTSCAVRLGDQADHMQTFFQTRQVLRKHHTSMNVLSLEEDKHTNPPARCR